MRVPSIHVLRGDLERIINKHTGLRISQKVLDQIMREARGCAINSRSALINTKKEAKTASSRLTGDLASANLLAQIICSVRVKMKHLSVKKITQADTQWASVKELVQVVNSFCERYNLEQREGYIQFVETGLKLMAKGKKVNYNFCASWMLQRTDWILQVFEANNLQKSDDNPEETLAAHEYFIGQILSMTGIQENYLSDPTNYVHFYNMRKMAEELGVEITFFIDAQFDALAFCNGIPDIRITDKTKHNVIKYMAKHKVNAKKPKINLKPDVWDSFK